MDYAGTHANRRRSAVLCDVDQKDRVYAPILRRMIHGPRRQQIRVRGQRAHPAGRGERAVVALAERASGVHIRFYKTNNVNGKSTQPSLARGGA